MSYSRKKRSIIPDNSPIVLTFTLGLLLLSLFIALSANRVPNSVKKTMALRSIAANFRKTSSAKVDQSKLQDKVSTDLSHPGIVKLTGLIGKFFGPDATLMQDATNGIAQLADQVKLTNASLELYCQSAASGVSVETAYQRLTEAEKRCERVAEIFRQEGVPNFNIASRAGFRLTTDDNIQFVIRGESFRSSWE